MRDIGFGRTAVFNRDTCDEVRLHCYNFSSGCELYQTDICTTALSLQLLEARVFVLTVNGERTVNASVNCRSDETLPTFYDYRLWYLTHGYAPSSFFLTLLCFLCLYSNYVQITTSGVGLSFTSTSWNVVTNFLKEITETLFVCLYIVKLKQ